NVTLGIIIKAIAFNLLKLSASNKHRDNNHERAFFSTCNRH
ncbi:MAG: hypothetical protein ACJAR6_001333, partial [Oleispira sp.]